MKKTYKPIFNNILLILLILLSGFIMQQKEKVVLIHTDFGDMKVKLYNETPLHNNNFYNLAKTGAYNGSIFHRIINGFMIQGGGKPGSKGRKDIGEPIPAEIMPKYFHKKGALSAARMPDNINPKKESSGSQFYIVQGKKYSDAELDQFEARTGRKYTKEQRDIYKTIGGTPHLDMEYTVFGEVIEGIEIIDKIAAAATGPGDMPVKDVSITMKAIEK